jgi:hypothetical protein
MVEKDLRIWMKWLISLLLLVTSKGYARVISDYGIKFGAVSSVQTFERGKAKGHSMSWESYLDREWKHRIGPQFGLFARIINTRHFALEGEVSYLQKGTDEKVYTTLLGPNGTYITSDPFTAETFQFDYIAPGVFVQVKVSIGQTEPYILIGPLLNILIAKREFTLRDADSLTPSMVIGGGFEFKKLFEFPLLIEFRYNPDLRYFFENDYLKSKLRVWQLILGVKLNH